MRRRLRAAARALCAALPLWPCAAAWAGQADVVGVEVHCYAVRQCRFDVTVRHDDTGWDHYANLWEVLAPDGTLLGTRVLRHPHVGEQPFTRSLPWVRIPEGVTEVRIRARDSQHGFGGAERVVAIPAAAGP